MAPKLTKEDVMLVLEAMRADGWSMDPAKINGRFARLTTILQALIDGKMYDVMTPPPEVGKDQALEVIKNAIIDLEITASYEPGAVETAGMHMTGGPSHQVVTSVGDGALSITMRGFQIAPFINYIKNKLVG